MLDHLSLISTSSSKLAKKLYAGELTEKEVKQLPAQVVYMALKTLGLDSAQDIISTLTEHQYQVILDFEFWSGDKINEANIWNWLTVIDDAGIEQLGTFTERIDQNILVLLVGKYVQSVVNETNDGPSPYPGGYTPDNGYTWINIDTGNENNNHRLKKLLEYIVGTDPDYFYQLLYMPKTCTPSELEEESFGEKSKRLTSEGIPELDVVFKMNAPLNIDHAKLMLKQSGAEHGAEYTFIQRTPYPISKGAYSAEPLRSFLRSVVQDNPELILDIEYEFAGLINAAIMFYKIDFSDLDQVQKLIEKVKETVNAGLDKVMAAVQETNYDAIYKQIGIQNLYRLGLAVKPA